MLSRNDILETIRMIDQQHLDIRTITMGISLLSCADSSAERACEKIYDKISRYAERLVATGEEIEREFGIPIVNKRVSVTPIALVAAASETEDYVPFAKALDRAAKNVGVNFIGGNQHGRRRPDGADGKKDGSAHGKAGRLWLRQACDLLQCGRG